MINNSESINISYFDKKIKLKLPNSLSCKLAEFIGILTGDGYMNKYKKYFSLLEIAGDSRLDCDYLLNYVSSMIKFLFNLEPKIYFKKNQNSMYLRLMSKGLNNYLESIGFKKGKKGQINIPLWILENNKYMQHFIKGLADTDGSLVLLDRSQKKYKYYPRVQITSISEPLIINIGAWLRNQGISLSIMKDKKKLVYNGEIRNYEGYRFQISGRKNLEKWMELISFRNKRHLEKYGKYKMGLPGF